MAKRPEDLGRHQCEACGADFSSREELDQHMDSEHQMAEVDER